MYIIQDRFVSDEVLERKFCCDLSKCKGACCWAGDFGAPLTSNEMALMDDSIDVLTSLVDKASKDLIQSEGAYRYYPGMEDHGTAIHEDDGRCVFLSKGDDGIGQCTIEQAALDGIIAFQKPLSCHLYPIRVTKDGKLNFEALNYDDWSICNPALEKGYQLDLDVIKFLKQAILRAYGQAFYDDLVDAQEQHSRLST